MHIFRQKFILISLAFSPKTEFEKRPIRTWFKYIHVYPIIEIKIIILNAKVCLIYTI